VFAVVACFLFATLMLLTSPLAARGLSKLRRTPPKPPLGDPDVIPAKDVAEAVEAVDRREGATGREIIRPAAWGHRERIRRRIN
jgi:hypothetical protein